MKKLLFSLYGFSFFNKFLLLTPVYAIFMQSHGLNGLALSSMFIIAAAATVLGQIPITYIINKIGPRDAMILGQILKIIAVLLWLIIPTYIGFAVGMVLWGIQTGFRSTAFETLMYETIAAHGATDKYQRILGRRYTYESIGVALSAFGSLLMFLGYAWVTITSVLAIAISIGCLTMIKKTTIPEITPGKPPRLKKLLKTGIRVTLKTPCLISIMMLTILVVNIPFLDDFLSPIGLQLGISTEYVGILSFFLLLCATLGQRYSYKFAGIPDKILYLLIGAVGTGYITFAYIYSIGAIWILGVSYMLFYGIHTLLYSQFQHMIPTTFRSVILSLYTIIAYIIYMIVCAIIGIGTTLGSWRYSIMILGILMIALCLWSLLFTHKRFEIANVDKPK